MNCTTVRVQLPALVYGDLPAGEADEVRAHLVRCASCRKEHTTLMEMRGLLEQTPAPAVTVDLPRLYREAAAQQARRWRRWRRIAFAAVAAAAVVVLGVFLSRMEVRLDGNQLVLRWGAVPNPEPPAPPQSVPQPPPVVADAPSSSTTAIEQQLHLLTELVQAVSNDADLRDERRQRELSRLRAEVHTLQEHLTELRLATEKDVSALYSAQFPNGKVKGASQ